MNDAVQTIDRLISNLEKVLRYIAPGFAALFVVAAVFPDSRTFLESGSPAVVALGMLLGPTIYGFHAALLFRGLWWFLIWLCFKENRGHIFDTMSELDDQRWLRRASEEPEVKAIQGETDKWAAMQNFLYCLSYTMILVPAFAAIVNQSLADRWVWIILVGGFVVLLATLYSERGLTKKEMELKEKYPGGKKTKPEA